MKLPKYIKIDWTIKPTEFDPIGCDGMYLKSPPKVKWWGWPLIIFKFIRMTPLLAIGYFPYKACRIFFVQNETENIKSKDKIREAFLSADLGSEEENVEKENKT